MGLERRAPIGWLRRTAPALCGAVLLWLPVACEDSEESLHSERPRQEDPPASGVPWDGSPGWSPETAPRGGSSAEATARTVGLVQAVSVPSPPAGLRTRVSVAIDGDDTVRGLDSALLFLAGYYEEQLGPSGRPPETAVPTFSWRATGSARSWPEELDLELPIDGRSRFVAWLDLDSSGSLSTGDRLSRPTEPLGVDGASRLELRIDRLFISQAEEPGRAPRADAERRSPAPERSEPTAPSEPGGGGCGGRAEPEPRGRGLDPEAGRTVRIDALPASREAGAGRLIVYGFGAEQLNHVGMPHEGVEPSLVWVDTQETSSWPALVRVPVPEAEPGLRLLPVLDLDGNGRLGEGDHLGTALSLEEATGEDGVITLVVEASLPGRTVPGSGPPVGVAEAPPGAAGSSGAQAEVPSNRLPGAAVDAASAPKLRVRVDAGEAARGTGPGHLMVYCYPASALNSLGMPMQDSQPVYLWVSDQLITSWPSELEIPDPLASLPELEPEGFRIVLGLDVDGSGFLSSGDFLSSAVAWTEAETSLFELSSRLAAEPVRASTAPREPAPNASEIPFPSTAPKESAGCNMGSGPSRL